MFELMLYQSLELDSLQDTTCKIPRTSELDHIGMQKLHPKIFKFIQNNKNTKFKVLNLSPVKFLKLQNRLNRRISTNIKIISLGLRTLRSNKTGFDLFFNNFYLNARGKMSLLQVYTITIPDNNAFS